MLHSWTIGAMSSRTGLTPATIRYYESIGLLPRIGRTANGRRDYAEQHLQRLQLIRRCRDFGLAIDDVRVIIAAVDRKTPDCADLRTILLGHAAMLRHKRLELRALETQLTGLASSCQPGCQTPGQDGCSIVTDLLD